MARRDNVYSRLVGMLKVVLPLTALSLLSTLFLVARTINPDDALPYAQVDIDELLRDPRLTAPSFSGMTRQGDEIAFTATTAHPGGESQHGARALDPVLRLTAPDGSETRVTATEARIDPSANELVLSQNVNVQTTTGYQLQSEELRAMLDQSQLDSPGPVQAEAPQTQITADSMQLTRQGADAPELLVFKGRVKLLYQPAKTTPAPQEKLP